MDRVKSVPGSVRLHQLQSLCGGQLAKKLLQFVSLLLCFGERERTALKQQQASELEAERGKVIESLNGQSGQHNIGAGIPCADATYGFSDGLLNVGDGKPVNDVVADIREQYEGRSGGRSRQVLPQSRLQNSRQRSR